MAYQATPPWYVLTAGPSAGKTTLLGQLQRRGYRTVPEAARKYLNSERDKGLTIEEIRSDEIGLQYRILELKRMTENNTPRDEIVFFDRGIHDTLAYLWALGVDLNKDQICQIIDGSAYRKVFLFDMLPFIVDDVRTESLEQAAKIHSLLKASYELSRIPIVQVPVLPPIERADFVLQHL